MTPEDRARQDGFMLAKAHVLAVIEREQGRMEGRRKADPAMGVAEAAMCNMLVYLHQCVREEVRVPT